MRNGRVFAGGLAGLAALMLAGCGGGWHATQHQAAHQSAHQSAHQPAHQPAQLHADCDLTAATTLFLGRGMAAGATVSEAEWQRFLAEHVETPFPGHTVVDATGYWKGAAEKTKMLTILHTGAPGEAAALTAIADAWRTRFEQEAVLRADAPTCATFIP